MAIISLPIIIKGYNMYQNAINTQALADKVQEIRQQDNYVKLADVDPDYLQSLIQSEDRWFYIHPGINPVSIVRATFVNIVNQRFSQGGSTITQQLAKNMYFSFEKKLERKVAELFVVLELELNYTKDELLELYINMIYFGENVYGIKNATLHYYNTLPNDLTEQQINQLVYTIKSPENYNPHVLNNPPISTSCLFTLNYLLK